MECVSTRELVRQTLNLAAATDAIRYVEKTGNCVKKPINLLKCKINDVARTYRVTSYC